MNTFYWILICMLMLLLVAGLLRVAKGPTLSDRISATLLLGTTGTAILVLLNEVLAMSALVDAALVLVLLAVVAAVAFSRFTQTPAENASESTEGAAHVA